MAVRTAASADCSWREASLVNAQETLLWPVGARHRAALSAVRIPAGVPVCEFARARKSKMRLLGLLGLLGLLCWRRLLSAQDHSDRQHVLPDPDSRDQCLPAARKVCGGSAGRWPGACCLQALCCLFRLQWQHHVRTWDQSCRLQGRSALAETAGSKFVEEAEVHIAKAQHGALLRQLLAQAQTVLSKASAPGADSC